MLVIYTDGSYNPKTKKAGWAFVTDRGTEKYGECEKFHEYRNIAGELEAILQALNYAASIGRENVIIYTDLQGAYCWAEGLWARNNECTDVYYQRVTYCKQIMKIKFNWIRGHSNDPLNDKADELAKKAVGVKLIKKSARLTWQKLQDDIAIWSDATFGSDREPTAPLYHLKKEVEELIAEPYDRIEFADCFMLLIDAARMADINCKQILTDINYKLGINKKRNWGEPDKNGVVEHIR